MDLITISLLSLLFSLSAPNERLNSDALRLLNENAYVMNHCRQTGGSFLLTAQPAHSICCYKNKCLHIDSKKGTSEIILRFSKNNQANNI